MSKASSKPICVTSIQPRRRPKKGNLTKSMTGDQINFQVKGRPISAIRPMVFKSTCSLRNHAGIRLIRK